MAKDKKTKIILFKEKHQEQKRTNFGIKTRKDERLTDIIRL